MAYEEAFKVEKEAKIEGVPEAKKEKKEEVKVWNSQIVRESSTIPDELKGNCIDLLWDKGLDAMREFLKSHDIEI